jgi:hypothetical protein
VTNVTPLDLGPLGATRFLVEFTAQSAPGTYSYTVGDETSAALPFSDGFESGDTSAWSVTVP